MSMRAFIDGASVRFGWFVAGALIGAFAAMAIVSPAHAQEAAPIVYRTAQRVVMTQPVQAIDGQSVRDGEGQVWRIANIDAPQADLAAILLDLTVARGRIEAELVGQLDHDQALLEGGVVLHLAVEHHRGDALHEVRGARRHHREPALRGGDLRLRRARVR